MSQHAACRQSSQSSGQFPDPLDSRKASSTFRVCRGAGDPCAIRSASGRRCQLQQAVAARRLCSLPLRRTAPAAMGSMAAMRSPREAHASQRAGDQRLTNVRVVAATYQACASATMAFFLRQLQCVATTLQIPSCLSSLSHQNLSLRTLIPAFSLSQVSAVMPSARKTCFISFCVGVLGSASTIRI